MKSDHLPRHLALLLFAVVVLAWGSNWPVTKSMVQSMPPLWTAALLLDSTPQVPTQIASLTLPAVPRAIESKPHCFAALLPPAPLHQRTARLLI